MIVTLGISDGGPRAIEIFKLVVVVELKVLERPIVFTTIEFCTPAS